MFITALFIMAKIYKQPECPAVGRGKISHSAASHVVEHTGGLKMRTGLRAVSPVRGVWEAADRCLSHIHASLPLLSLPPPLCKHQ